LFQATLSISCRFLAQRSVRRLRCLRKLAAELHNFQRSCALEDAEMINWSRKQRPASSVISYPDAIVLTNKDEVGIRGPETSN
jgi:hypothetical protein